MKNLIFLAVISGLIFFNAEAQVVPDSLQETMEETDTIIVQEDPVIISQPLVVEHLKVARFYVHPNFSLFGNSSYYYPCTECKEFLNEYKKTVYPKLGYSAGIQFIYAPGKFIGGVELDYTSIREQFRARTGSADEYMGINNYNFMDISLTGGYWLRRNKKNLSVILSGGIVYSRLLSAEGWIPDFNNPGSLIRISEADVLRENGLSLTLGSKIVLKSGKRIKLSIEPYYKGNITDTMKNPYAFLQLRNMYGLKMGLIYSM